MDIERLEALLGIKLTEDSRPMYEARLEAAIAHINELTSDRFQDKTTEVITFPPDVQMGAALLVEEMGKHKTNGVASRTLSDMSLSFFEGGGYRAAAKYWRKYVKARYY